jgi:hypothetical protein
VFFLWHAPPSAMRTTRPQSNRPVMPPDVGPLLPLFVPLDLLHDATTSFLLDMTVQCGIDLVVYFDGRSETSTSMTMSRELRMHAERREGTSVICGGEVAEAPFFSKICRIIFLPPGRKGLTVPPKMIRNFGDQLVTFRI